MPASVYRYAGQSGARTYRAGRDFRMQTTPRGLAWTGRTLSYADLPRPALRGAFQLHNAAAVLMVCECLSGNLPLTRSAIVQALQSVRLAGRTQIVPGSPTIVLDVAHNPQAVRALLDNLSELALPGRLHGVFGILQDKDLAAILAIIGPALSSWHLVDTPGPRGQSAERLKARLTELGVRQNLFSCGDLSRALRSARRVAGATDAILVFGSFLLVGEFLENLSTKAID
jgi:dihydrofolate synthase/folylpolyglutamate synthase